ncbi:MAG: hypothetical protein LBD18_05835 [Treponema sp.]|nr:hypothetical protein [Treponema sp.]
MPVSLFLAKAFLLISVIPSGMVTLVSSASEKAEAPIILTGFPPIAAGMVIAVSKPEYLVMVPVAASKVKSALSC